MEKLTNLEEMIMKCIWDYGEEIPFLQIGKELKERYGKEYKRTSIRTYLFRLEDKEYLLLSQIGNENEDILIFRVDNIEGKEELNLVEDDKEFLAVKKEYKKLIY